MLGDKGNGIQNDGCDAWLVGYWMHYEGAGEDIMSTNNYGRSTESTYKFLPDRTMASGYENRIWVNMYKVINQANQIIDALPNASGSDSDKAAIKGQVLALRGIAYFQLIVNYQQTYAIAQNKRGVILRTSSED